jgi:hypothetical protein
MREYLVEIFQPSLGEDDRDVAAQRARRAAETHRGTGVVHYLRSIFVPEDQVTFHVFASGSADAVSEALLEQGLEYERIVEAIETGVVTEGGK